MRRALRCLAPEERERLSRPASFTGGVAEGRQGSEARRMNDAAEGGMAVVGLADLRRGRKFWSGNNLGTMLGVVWRTRLSRFDAPLVGELSRRTPGFIRDKKWASSRGDWQEALHSGLQQPGRRGARLYVDAHLPRRRTRTSLAEM